MPLLAAFRWYVLPPDTLHKTARWRNGFEEVLDVWNQLGGKLMSVIIRQYKDSRGNANVLGKDRGLWERLYTEVQLDHFKRQKQNAEKAAA